MNSELRRRWIDAVVVCFKVLLTICLHTVMKTHTKAQETWSPGDPKPAPLLQKSVVVTTTPRRSVI
jgi:hypothetical protein